MTNEDDQAISVIYTDFGAVEGEKGVFAVGRQAVTRVADLDVRTLSANLTSLTARIGAAIDSGTAPARAFELESFEVTVEISAGGEIRLIGSVASEVRGGLKLVFRRRPEVPDK
jgi:hypothetical protein